MVSEEHREGAPHSNATSGQRATAPGTAQQSSSSAVSDQRATAQGEAQTSSSSSTAQADAQGTEKNATTAASSTNPNRDVTNYDRVMQPTGLKGVHDILWPSPPVILMRPSLVTGLTIEGLNHFVANLREWEESLPTWMDIVSSSGMPCCL